MKTALITGVTGQDGSYLSEFLLDKGYEVHGIIRRSSVDYRERIAHLEGQPHFHLHYADMSDSMGLIKVIGKVRPELAGEDKLVEPDGVVFLQVVPVHPAPFANAAFLLLHL